MSFAADRKRPLSVLLIIASAPMLVSIACAHAFLDHTTPAVGSVVHGAPAQVKLWFRPLPPLPTA